MPARPVSCAAIKCLSRLKKQNKRRSQFFVATLCPPTRAPIEHLPCLSVANNLEPARKCLATISRPELSKILDSESVCHNSEKKREIKRKQGKSKHPTRKIIHTKV